MSPSPTPLRIVAVTNNLLLGGATTFLLNFLQALQGRPERLSVVSTGLPDVHASDFAALGADVRVGELDHLIYEDRLRWAYREIAELRPHAVLACLSSESFEMLRLAPPGVARIGLIQADDPLPYEMAARYHGSLDAMVGVSRQIGARLRARPELAGVRVAEIPYGIHFRESPPRAPRGPGEPLRVLYLGRLIEEQKRISRVIELVRRCERFPERFRFTVAGGGPAAAEVHAALASSPIVTLAGEVPNREVPALLRAHDVYLLLSDYEGLPLSLLEAMGEGVVPVVSDLPSGIAETVTAETGLRVPIGDVAAAEAALHRLWSEPLLGAELAAAAQARARGDYSAARMAERYLELIRSIRGEAGVPAWAPDAAIPAPLGLKPWLYRGLARRVRRALKAAARRRA